MKSKIVAVPILPAMKEKEIAILILIALANSFVAEIIVTGHNFPIPLLIAVLTPTVTYFNYITCLSLKNPY